MSKPNIKKLKYPVWYTIVFAVLTIIIPIGLFVYECLRAGSTQKATVFKVTFLAITVLLIAWLFINHFVIKKYKSKLITERSLLEHDYVTENGNLEKIEYLWYNTEKILVIFEIIEVILIGALGTILLIALEDGIIKLKGSLILIATCYIIAYTIKLMLLGSKKEAESEGNSGGESSQDSIPNDEEINKEH